DAIVPDRPVYLIGRDGHMALANSEALRRAGIDRNTPDPKQGHILHDAAGEPTGELNGKAVQRVIELIPPPSPAKLLKRFQAIQDEAASYGVTSVQNLGELQGPELAVIVQLLETQGLKLRIYSVATLRNSSDQQIQHYQELKQKYAGPMFKFGGAKGILDGTIDASTAFMLEPLTNGQAGLSYWDSNELNVAVARFDAAGFQVMLHAVGDAAIKQAIDAFANASQVNGAAGRRYRIEHLDIPSARDLERMKTLGVIASSQPNFAYPDATNLGNYALLLGPERMQRAQAYRSIDDAGLVQAFASDFPVSSMNVLIALHTALTRQNLQREPPGGWYPQQRIGIEAALRHFTIDGAYASFDEQIKGSLTVGKLADFLVVSRDILTADKDPAILLEARVLLTVMGGRVTFESPQAGL
ncbi:MAG: amidohydrolase, partial [Xanthomonadales bacterium]|nr:amidohydrolase [Xanthomonadales bacterium]